MSSFTHAWLETAISQLMASNFSFGLVVFSEVNEILVLPAKTIVAFPLYPIILHMDDKWPEIITGEKDWENMGTPPPTPLHNFKRSEQTDRMDRQDCGHNDNIPPAKIYQRGKKPSTCNDMCCCQFLYSCLLLLVSYSYIYTSDHHSMYTDNLSIKYNILSGHALYQKITSFIAVLPLSCTESGKQWVYPIKRWLHLGNALYIWW